MIIRIPELRDTARLGRLLADLWLESWRAGRPGGQNDGSLPGAPGRSDASGDAESSGETDNAAPSKRPAEIRGDFPGVLLLQGDLGAGKTTLVRLLVESLPGSERAEVSSPSFTLCNSYATSPEVLHFDLYRLEPWQDDEDLADALEMAENRDLLLIIEWPERMKENLLPAELIYCSLTDEGAGRAASFKTRSDAGRAFLRVLAERAAQAGLDVEPA